VIIKLGDDDDEDASVDTDLASREELAKACVTIHGWWFHCGKMIDIQDQELAGAQPSGRERRPRGCWRSPWLSGRWRWPAAARTSREAQSCDGACVGVRLIPDAFLSLYRFAYRRRCYI
jgi:hypothetical protein